jgi:uncharacterized protein YdiU (UPF0061 family)
VYVAWLKEVGRRTARTVAKWMAVGFVHGVMNTDNMSILGLTIDYGPYGWLEGYDPAWTPNTTDAQGRRYCFGRQPQIAHWNLVRLANALYPLVGDKAPLEQGLATYADTFNTLSGQNAAAKLGLRALDQAGDEALLNDLYALLQEVETDMTLFFRGLSAVPVEDAAAADEALVEPLRRAFYTAQGTAPAHVARVVAWLRRYASRVRQDGALISNRRARMNRVNPKYVLRNYLAQLAIDALGQGDASFLERLMAVLQGPYDEQPEHDELAERRPEWARHKPGCSALSCSS